jgi:hypothetical protein
MGQPKGQLNSKCFWCLPILPKNDRKQFDLRYHSSYLGRIFSFVFLEELKILTRHFEINWPLIILSFKFAWILVVKDLFSVWEFGCSWSCCHLNSNRFDMFKTHFTASFESSHSIHLRRETGYKSLQFQRCKTGESINSLKNIWVRLSIVTDSSLAYDNGIG